MDKRIAIPAGLAIMVALAVVGMLSIFSLTATQPAEASISEIAQGIGDNVDLAKFEEPFSSPLQATAVVTGTLAVAISPQKPSRASSFTLTFDVDSILNNGTDEIIITFEDDFSVPATLDRNQITISADSVVNTGAANAPTPGQAVSPQEVTIDFVGVKQKPQVSLRVPDLDTDDNTGGNGISGTPGDNARVTVIFRQGANIITPSEGKSSYEIDVRVTVAGIDPGSGANVQNNTIFMPTFLDMDSDDAKRGGDLTVVAKGVEGNESLTFFLDTDLDGTRDAIERDLCTVLSASSDTATCTLNISNPPFNPGLEKLTASGATVNDGGTFAAGDTTLTHVAATTPFVVGELLKIENEYLRVVTVPTTTSLTLTRGIASTDAAHADGVVINRASVNFINFRDSEGRSTSGATGAAIDAAALARQNLELDQVIQIAPSTAAVGDRVTVSLFDFPAGLVTKITIGGTAVKAADLPVVTVPASGEVSFTFVIPGRLLGEVRTPTGKVPVKVFAGGSNEDTNVTIGGAKLSLSHATVVPNQDLTITGSGFSEGSNICIVEGQVTINNVAVEIDDASDCPAATLAAQTPVATEGILLTSGGTFTMTVRVHDANSTTSINTALLTEGSHELKIIDTAGSEGTVQVVFLDRELNVTPLSARPRDVVTIIGRNFISDNPDGLSGTVEVTYQCGSNTRTATADPDVSGNFRETLRIPTGCSIPSTNTITAKIKSGGTDTGVVETVTHEIPDALVRVDPPSGVPGSTVTVSGEGFRTFETVQKIEFGDLGVLGGRTVNTDGNGNFSVDDILVPGEDPGVHALKIEVGTGTNRTTSSTSFEILEGSGIAGAATTAIADALEPLFTGDTLDRAFFFNNVVKEWDFFINDADFLSANTLDDVASGQPLWIKVTGNTSVELGSQPFDLTCVNPGTPEEDCWNLIVFP